MATIDLRIVYEPCPAELAELSAVLAEITSETPLKEEIPGLAGPNEFVQMLLDAATWQNALRCFAVTIGGVFASSFAKELGKHVEAEHWKNKENYYNALKKVTTGVLRRLVRAIQALRAKDQTVTIAIRIPGLSRNAGLLLTSDDEAVILWQIANVIRCAEQIREIVTAAQATPGWARPGLLNRDFSIPVEVLDNGDVKVLGKVISK